MSKTKPNELQELPVCSCVNDVQLFEKNFYLAQKVLLKCVVCNRIRKTSVRYLTKDRDAVCTYCKQKQHLKEKYGVDNVSQLKDVQNKKIQTNLKRYGRESYSQTDERKVLMQKRRLEGCYKNAIVKGKATKLLKYGSETYNNPSKIQETWRNKGSEEIQRICENRKATLKRVYGKENYVNVEKARGTIEKHFGSAEKFYEQRKEKIKATNLKKFGVESPMQNHSIRVKAQKRYTYENQYFDSSWELAVWIWAKENSKKIIREPCSFSYEYNGTIHQYFPDFSINDELIEVKGDQFFENGKMICPWNRKQDDVYEAKHRCMLAHNVHIWKRENVKEALDYVQKTHGRKFLESFRN